MLTYADVLHALPVACAASQREEGLLQAASLRQREQALLRQQALPSAAGGSP
jgi:hypothetical protein